MTESTSKAVSKFRTCMHCGREYATADELFGNYLAVSFAVNKDAVLVDDPEEIEFCPNCGQDFATS